MFPLSGISIRVSQSATGYRYLRGRVAARSKWARWRTETPPGGQVAPGADIVFCSLDSWTGFNRGRSRSVPRLRRILSLSRWRCSGREEEESVGPWAERRLNGFNEPLRSSNRENQSWTGPNITDICLSIRRGSSFCRSNLLGYLGLLWERGYKGLWGLLTWFIARFSPFSVVVIYWAGGLTTGPFILILNKNIKP